MSAHKKKHCWRNPIDHNAHPPGRSGISVVLPLRAVRTGETVQVGHILARPTSAEWAGAFLAGSIAHLLLLIPTLITLQIYDRVLSSRSTETLLMLLAAAALS